MKFVITNSAGETHEITGSSIGGGQVVISDIDGMEVNFTGERPILVTHHKDEPGVISNITFILYEMGINIGKYAGQPQPRGSYRPHVYRNGQPDRR